MNVVIERAEVKYDGPSKSWWVVHPSNGAIVAYLDTEEQARAFVSGLHALATLVSASEKPAPHVVAFSLPADKMSEVEDWIDNLILSNDLFRQVCAGYWLSPVHYFEHREGSVPEDSFLACERDDSDDIDDDEAIRSAVAGVLPRGFHLITREVGLRAWRAGAERWGIGWLDDLAKLDASREECTLQLALFGEVKYG